MEGNVETLAQENAELRQQNAQLQRERTELTKQIDILGEQLAWLKRRFFSRSSETLSDVRRHRKLTPWRHEN